MTTKNGQRVIALEEHYYDAEVVEQFKGRDARNPLAISEKLYDLGEIRLREMDNAGIDLQVLSHGAPSTQRMDAETSIRVSKAANDRLKDACAVHPDRLAGFAQLPTPDPKAAADELSRAVNELGMKGAMIHGPTNGEFLDQEKYWPIFERAQALDVPLYIHPAIPKNEVIEAYYKEYADDFPGFITAGWGFTVETATMAIRMVLSGAFEKFPDLKIVLGHLGETIPFLIWRIDQAVNRPANKRSVPFREIFSNNFWITTSGNFSDPALLCCIQEMSVDHIMFSVDWPFVDNEPGVEWIERLMLNDADKAKILHGNAEKLLKL